MSIISNSSVLQCSRCPNTADVERDPRAADGWVITNPIKCATCVDEQERKHKVLQESRTLKIRRPLGRKRWPVRKL